MHAMRLHRMGPVTGASGPLSLDEVPVPTPGECELLVRVLTCGVCRTEIDEIEGRTPPAKLPMTPGHQVVGEVVAAGPGCVLGLEGTRVGVAWIHSACGHCSWCQQGLENLCPDFLACGRDVHGGYAQFMTVREDFVYRIPGSITDAQAAPLLCAGAVGLRSLRLCELVDGAALGLTGFGASAHLVLQMARHLYPDSSIYVFARRASERAFAIELGAAWSGDTEDMPPRPPAAIIDTTPAWRPVLAALEQLAPGGRLVINAIRKETADQEILQTLDYARHLWREKSIQSVANVARQDVIECLELATRIPLVPEVSLYPLEAANRALCELKDGNIRGAKVLQISAD